MIRVCRFGKRGGVSSVGWKSRTRRIESLRSGRMEWGQEGGSGWSQGSRK